MLVQTNIFLAEIKKEPKLPEAQKYERIIENSWKKDGMPRNFTVFLCVCIFGLSQ
jgi:hypothetical protein